MATMTVEGIILKRRNLGEADRILTVLTKTLGKITIIAKGVRRITSRRSGNVEVLNRVKLHLFKGKNYTLTEAESIQTYQHIKENLTLSTSAFHIIELVDRLIQEDQVHPSAYQLLSAGLELLDKNPRQLFIRAFEVKLLSSLGFFSTAGIANLEDRTKELLEKLENWSWNEINQLQISEAESKGLEDLNRGYIEKILESKLKSVSVMRQLKK